MGRETKFLLALLGLLGGVFVGVLSLKLFVPRPPAGTGPDVIGDVATIEAQAIVEPPDFNPAAAAEPFAAAPPELMPDAPETAAPSVSPRGSRFAVADPAPDAPPDAERDPFVAAASYEATEPYAEAGAGLQPLPPTGQASAADLLPPPSFEPVAPRPAERSVDGGDFPEPQTAPSFSPGPSPVPPPPLGQTYVTQSGDSWWSLAERAYGDGRLYRALFAWNRMLDPRVSLVPGTRLEIPPAAKLGAAWPTLLPRD